MAEGHARDRDDSEQVWCVLGVLPLTNESVNVVMPALLYTLLSARAGSLLIANVLVCLQGSVEKHRLCWGFASEPYLTCDCTLLIANFS